MGPMNHKNMATTTTEDVGQQDLLSGHCCPCLTGQPGLHKETRVPSEGGGMALGAGPA